MKLPLLVKSIESDYMQKTIPFFTVGSFVAVDVVIQEGDKKRLQSFSGLLVNYHKAGVNSTITIRRYSGALRVSRIFPIYSDDVQNVTLLVLRKKRVK